MIFQLGWALHRLHCCFKSVDDSVLFQDEHLLYIFFILQTASSWVISVSASEEYEGSASRDFLLSDFTNPVILLFPCDPDWPLQSPSAEGAQIAESSFSLSFLSGPPGALAQSLCQFPLLMLPAEFPADHLLRRGSNLWGSSWDLAGLRLHRTPTGVC